MLHLDSMTGCPRAQRVRIHLKRKAIEFNDRKLDASWPRPTGHRAVLPLGHGPILSDGGALIGETTAITDYIEDLYPDPSMFPAAPLERAGMRELIALCDQVFARVLSRVLNEDRTTDGLAWSRDISEAWHSVERLIVARGLTGLVTQRDVGAADAAFGPYFQRYAMFGLDRSILRSRPASLRHVLRWRERLLVAPLLVGTAAEPPRDTVSDLIRVPRLSEHVRATPRALPPPDPTSRTARQTGGLL